MVIPLQQIGSLAAHDLNLVLPKGNGPGQGTDGIVGHIQGQQLPEFIGYRAVKIAVDPTAGEGRGTFGAPYDPIEFLPGIAVIPFIKIDNGQLPS